MLVLNKFKIEALFRHLIVYTDTKKTHTHYLLF